MRGHMLGAGLVLACAAGGARAQADLLPDIIVGASQLYDNRITVENGRRLLRLSNSTPNIGLGKLYLYGATVHDDGTRDVVQRIFREDGTSWDRLAGRFVNHPTHSHIHFEDWAIYRLRVRGPADEIGEVVAEGSKTSFCILDLQIYDASLPNFDPNGEFRNCGSTIQGLSVGWMDIYSKDLEGQWIDITGVPDGNYWLESTVDPDNHVLELDEENNSTRIPIVLSGDSTVQPDAYEPSDSLAQVDGREVGKPSSPNLGPVGPSLQIPNLTLHKSGEKDYYRFYCAGTGVLGEYVRATYIGSPVTLVLYNANKQQIGLPITGNNGVSTMSLANRPAGWYYIRCATGNGSTTQNYTLEFKPPHNASPRISTTFPAEGDLNLTHGVDTLSVQWTASDPDADPTWVTVYLNTQPVLDGNEIIIPTSVNTPGAQGGAVVNSAYVEEGTYWVYCEVTDGGARTGSWSAGTVTFTETACAADFNHSGHVDKDDFDDFVTAFVEGSPETDFDTTGFVDTDDFTAFVTAFMAGC